MKRLILLLFCVASTLYSQESSSSKILIALSTRASDGHEHEDIKDIIDNAVAIEMNLRHYSLVRNDIKSEKHLLNFAENSYASYVIENLYSYNESTLTVNYRIIRVTDETVLGSGQFDTSLDMELDVSIQKEISLMGSLIEEDVESHPEFTVLIPAEEEPAPAPEIEEFLPLFFSAGFSPFFTTGKASNYFTIGFVPELAGQYRFPLLFGYLGIGAFVSLNYSRAEGSASTSENIFLSTGPLLQMGITMNPRLDFFMDINGGVSVFFLNVDEEGYKSTVIPYLSGGLGINIDIKQPLGLTVSTDFSLYFENSVFISGFSPFAGIYLNL